VSDFATIDFILLGALAVFAWAGWRNGFVSGVFSFAGFFLGGIAALIWIPVFASGLLPDGAARIAALAIAVIVSAILGQFLFSIIGRKLRNHITWRPVRFVDNFAGAALNVLAFALMGWVIASVLTFIPSSSLTQQVSNSKVLTMMDSLVPDAAQSMFSNISSLVGQAGIPRIVIGLGQNQLQDIAEPTVIPTDETVEFVQNFTARITGDAEACGQVVTGSGVYISESTVVTNAHVVAGVVDLQVRLSGVEQSLSGEVIYFDPEKDIAVIVTDPIDNRPALLARKDAKKGNEVVVAGFPGGGPLKVTPARVGGILSARGENIYGDLGVTREVYSLKSQVLPGNSGGPLLDQDGRVMGIVFGASEDSEVGYALTNSELADAIEFAENWKLSDGPASTGSCQLR
jgi:S1-C subfamily serine protease